MNKHVLFIFGGGGKEDYAADATLVASLQEGLGEAYLVHYPFLPHEQTKDFGRKKQIGRHISYIKGEIMLVGHSLGASMLLKYLSETRIRKRIAGLFLISTPFWRGQEDWKQGFILHKDFADKLPKHVPLFLDHSKDDKEVAFDHPELYAKCLPKARVRAIRKGGHQFNNDLSMLAKTLNPYENHSLCH
ncbi:alpha/beta hydrolase [Rhodocytophaga rosea]|uniref:Alpha/beta hydrolase n=1 Tax=Rhodocytophaga rosea TaxID=2704465 RepID=A0A6C0GDZ6_9BACT|nr:alpha/beta hydrolase [Rhodocytophaga rosea]QHT66229.1 alpha/beta hydrolase [Rhodocytophaga rosea]